MILLCNVHYQIFGYEEGTPVEIEDFSRYNNTQPEETVVHSMDGRFDIAFTSDVALQSKFFEIRFGTGVFSFISFKSEMCYYRFFVHSVKENAPLVLQCDISSPD